MPAARSALAPVAAVMALAVVTASVVGRRDRPAPDGGRLASLDGLRGYLALGVFIHHASMWRSFVQPAHSWFPGRPVPLYMHLGESAVMVFFLMTGFLFGAKLAQGWTRPIRWSRLYVGRVLRIYPLYGVVLAGVLAVVATRSGFRLAVPPAALARGVTSWLHFARPDLNGVADTWLVISGVTWSLAYEWLFYAALPLGALLVGARPALRWVALGAAGTAVWAHWLGAAVVALVPLRYAEPRQWPVLVLLTAAFLVVASGNTIFGLLRLPASRLLGEISYSLYMLHGLLLFLTLRGVLGMPAAAALPVAAYWGVVIALTPVLVGAALLTYRLVERPCLAATGDVHRWLTARAAWRPAPLLGRRNAARPAADAPLSAAS